MYRLLRFALASPLFCSLAAFLVASSADRGRAASPDPPVLDLGARETLRRYARDTWRSFEAMALPGGLSADGLRRVGDGAWRPTAKTTPTDIAAYLWSTLAAEELRII